jgi:hypothetical protein
MCVHRRLANSECYNLDIWQRSSTSERCLRSRWRKFRMDIWEYSAYQKHQRFLSSCLVHSTLVGFVVSSVDSTEAQSCNDGGEWSEAHRGMIRLLVAVRPSEDTWLKLELSSCDARFSMTNWRIWEKAPKQPAKFERRDIENRFTVTYL